MTNPVFLCQNRFSLRYISRVYFQNLDFKSIFEIFPSFWGIGDKCGNRAQISKHIKFLSVLVFFQAKQSYFRRYAECFLNYLMATLNGYFKKNPTCIVLLWANRYRHSCPGLGKSLI